MRVIAYLIEDREHLHAGLAIFDCPFNMVENLVCYIVVTGICKHHDWEAAECCHGALPMKYPDGTSTCHCITFDEVCHNKDDEISNSDQSDNACVFQGVQPP